MIDNERVNDLRKELQRLIDREWSFVSKDDSDEYSLGRARGLEIALGLVNTAEAVSK